jgi:SAM-dependent methyltransferase
MTFVNAYADARYAASYSRLEFANTYYLAYRDLPEIIRKHVRGRRAVDFGCGAGRSTRFLRDLGFDVVGVDIAENMIRRAREIDPKGAYLLIDDGDLSRLGRHAYDLTLSVFTFDNIPTMESKVRLFGELTRLLDRDGKIVHLVSSPDLYAHEWASFSTKDFPENRRAKCGDIVRVIIKDIDDGRFVEDVIWPDKDYRDVFRRTDLEVVTIHRPLADGSEPFSWVNETTIPPWVIYVLGPLSSPERGAVRRRDVDTCAD